MQFVAIFNYFPNKKPPGLGGLINCICLLNLYNTPPLLLNYNNINREDNVIKVFHFCCLNNKCINYFLKSSTTILSFIKKLKTETENYFLTGGY